MFLLELYVSSPIARPSAGYVSILYLGNLSRSQTRSRRLSIACIIIGVQSTVILPEVHTETLYSFSDTEDVAVYYGLVFVLKHDSSAGGNTLSSCLLLSTH